MPLEEWKLEPENCGARRRLWRATLFSALLAGLLTQAQPADNKTAESSKFFLQAFEVMRHPRCTNCHASGDAPRQGDDRHVHTLNVKRGPNSRGAAGLPCNACHQDRNLAGIPGASDWQFAPANMGWGELSAGEICRTITDTKKNGNRRPKGIVIHVENDPLVVWAWNPGDARTTPPLSHKEFVNLLSRWSQTGGACPN